MPQHEHAAERISAVGLTLFSPLYFGALPCVASNTAPSGPIFAPGATPNPPTKPGRQIAQHVAIQIRQHQHVVQLGLLHQLHAHVVDDPVLEFDVGILLGHLPRNFEKQPIVNFRMFALWTAVTFLRPFWRA